MMDRLSLCTRKYLIVKDVRYLWDHLAPGILFDPEAHTLDIVYGGQEIHLTDVSVADISVAELLSSDDAMLAICDR